MKIRSGFVTNSSSTNFLIISKDMLTKEYLAEKLGFEINKNSMKYVNDLLNDIFRNISNDEFGYQNSSFDYDLILEEFGKKAAEKYKKLDKKGYYTYIGYTSSDSNSLTAFITTDNFEINSKDFYMNGLKCVW